jgi:hypothetical protein
MSGCELGRRDFSATCTKVRISLATHTLKHRVFSETPVPGAGGGVVVGCGNGPYTPLLPPSTPSPPLIPCTVPFGALLKASPRHRQGVVKAPDVHSRLVSVRNQWGTFPVGSSPDPRLSGARAAYAFPVRAHDFCCGFSGLPFSSCGHAFAVRPLGAGTGERAASRRRGGR